MSLNTYELDKTMLDNSISQFRNIPEYVKICEAFAVGAMTIQNAINYLSDMQNIDKAEGIWLDYLASLVGTNRSSYNILNFFCVNAEHLNVEKEFYFEGITPDSKGNLMDVQLRKRVKAKVAYNTSKCTRNENIRIIKGVLNADRVVITNVEPMVLDITVYGDNIIYPSAGFVRYTIENILGNGVGLRNLIIED